MFSFDWNKDVPNNDMDILLEQSSSSYYNILLFTAPHTFKITAESTQLSNHHSHP